MRRRDASARAVPAASRREDGFSIVELLVGSVILILVVVAMSTMLTDSLVSAVTTKTRMTAASLASDAIENAKAIGQDGLAASPTSMPACGSTFTGSQSAAVFGTCSYTETVDTTTYTITPRVSTAASQPDTVTVTVTWNAGSRTFITTSQVGQQGTGGVQS